QRRQSHAARRRQRRARHVSERHHAFSGRKIFVRDSRWPPTMRYELMADDTITNGRVFVEDGADGMRVDSHGNLYTTSGGTPGRIQITSPQGKPPGRLHLPQPATEPRPPICPTNLPFGDADDRGLYITACTHVFKLRMKIPGVRPGQIRYR